VILTKDAEIKNNQLELISLLQSGTATFSLNSKNLNGREMAEAFVRAIPDIRRFLRKFALPFIARVNAAGRVSILLTHDGMIKKIERD
jgi:hypothetical protein